MLQEESEDTKEAKENEEIKYDYWSFSLISEKC
jgi:hypothetical protein